MSLVHAANHLAAQGRGGDTHLVHMTSKELAAMQKLAESQGKSLTINPKTGLPEAGMLSTVLPMALGALAVSTGQVELLPLIAAGVGVADYAMTGSLQQGLMAGLGTWSGGTLAAGLGAAGAAELAAQGANAGEVAFTSGQSAIGAGGAALPTGTIPTETGAFNTLTGTEITPQSIAQKQLAGMALPEGTAAGFNRGIQNASSLGEMGNVMRGAGAASTNPTMAQGLAQGITSPSALGSTLMDNKMAVAGLAAPLLASSLIKQPSLSGGSASVAQRNPFGMKEIPRDENGKPIFNATLPAPPNPPYEPVYRDYVKNPYVSGAANGGVIKMFGGGQIPVDLHGTVNINGQGGSPSAMASQPQTQPIGAMTAQYNPNVPSASNSYGGTGGPGAYPPIGGVGYAGGGIPRYKGSPDYGSMVEGVGEVERGLEIATKRKVLEAPNPYVDIEPDEPELRRLDAHNRARKMLEMLSSSSKVKMAKGLPQSNVLGSFSTDPAKVIAEQQAKQSIAQDSSAEAKEGGLMAMAEGGGIGHLGGYSDGGNLLRGPGDGVSDSIPATIGGKQPARLATGEFVIPARIVSELGNGSTDAGAKRLYAMMERIKAKRSKTKNIAADTKAYKYLPA